MEVIKKETLPEQVTQQLLENENAYYFSFIAFKGGCASSEAREDHWVCMTDKRMLYRSRVKDDNHITFIERNGVIRFDKISFIEVVKAEQNTGCSGVNVYYELRVGSSGGKIILPIPTEARGFEIRQAYIELSEQQR